MVKSCAKNMTSFLISNKAIEDDESELYIYGFETLIAFAINIAAILLVGAFFNKFTHTLLFLLCYCPIRQFSGGYHAENYKKCLMVFLSIYMLDIAILSVLINKISNISVIIMTLVCALIIIKYSPMEHRNNPLSKEERKRYKNTVMLLIGIVLLIVAIGIYNSRFYEYSIYMASSIWCTFIMLKLAIISKGKES
ncbi:accessory gene regulator ArgB-like protein [Clostridium sp.]|uniref:accessory gene regulator ArgB-like protein n=1 Tax=Clostridium sp. TaxID=1506 RepID=UPI003F2FDF91